MAELRVPRALLGRVAAHAGRSCPEECCGVLVGRDRSVDRVVPAANVAGDRTRRYAIAPESLLAVHKEARREGREVVGYYHSHPGGPARPSAFDLEHAWPGTSYLIVEMDGTKVVGMRSFRLGSGGDCFEEEELVSPAALDAGEIRRYGRHLTLPEVGVAGQERLKAARVLLVGAGGLGSPLGLYLAAAGVGTLGLVDDDRVEESNLHRQVLYGQSDLGRRKVDAAAERLRDVNPHVRLELHGERLDAGNALELVRGYDVVADGSDNFPTRYLVNDACVMAGKPVVWGAIQGFEGQLSVFWAARGPCYRCLFPEPPPPGLVPSCAEGGVIGVLPGVIGTLQANEVIKLVAGIGEPMIGRLLVFDALRVRFRELRLAKSADCPICGEAPTLTALAAYENVCQAEENMPETPTSRPVEDVPFDVEVQDLKTWLDEGRAVDLIDVREPHEHEICRIEGAKLIPLGDLPNRLAELDRAALIVVHCHHGPRSSHAVGFLRRQGFGKAANLAGGIEAWSLEIDPTVPRY
jgi:adenylyltransferase/sulfurtransferase